MQHNTNVVVEIRNRLQLKSHCHWTSSGPAVKLPGLWETLYS